jgi:hypothetical protein
MVASDGRSMSSDPDADTSRAVVQTYVPTYQKSSWQAHADELGMSQSEFVRTMVQAGRRLYDTDATLEVGPAGSGDGEADEGDSASTDGRATAVGDLESLVVSALADGEYLTWDELSEAVTGRLEERLDETLQELQSANRIQYSGRHGGYTLTEP